MTKDIVITVSCIVYVYCYRYYVYNTSAITNFIIHIHLYFPTISTTNYLFIIFLYLNRSRNNK